MAFEVQAGETRAKDAGGPQNVGGAGSQTAP